MTRLGLLLSGCWAVWALAEVPTAGSYLGRRGSGELRLVGGKKSGTFGLDVLGANGHTCQLSGKWTGARAWTTEDSPDSHCELTLDAKAGTVTVTAVSAEPCRSWCGMRAWLEGDYLTPAKGCRPAEVRKTRADFLAAFRAGQHAAAAALLEPLLGTCAPVLDFLVITDVRNDLALAWHKAGNDEACRAVLAPLQDLAQSPDDELGQGEPAYHDDLVRQAKATRFNLKLCAATTK